MSFYARVKARTEAAVAESGFDSVHIVRPSLLLGPRTESRPMEGFARWIAPVLNPLLRGEVRYARRARSRQRRWRRSLLTLARRQQRGVQVHVLPPG